MAFQQFRQLRGNVFAADFDGSFPERRHIERRLEGFQRGADILLVWSILDMSGDFQKGFLRAVLEDIAEDDVDEFVIVDEFDGDADGPRHAALMIGLLRFAFDETVWLFDPVVQPLGERFAFQREEM